VTVAIAQLQAGVPAREGNAPPRAPRRRHPLVRLAGTVGRLPRYMKLAAALMREPAVPKGRKAALAAGFGYALLPLDLIPGIIPVLGQLDDLAALLLGVRTALRGCPPDVAEAHLERVGLSHDALDHDLRTTGVAAAWLVTGAGRLGARALAAPLRLLGRGGAGGR